jgi:hypothetical protein
VAGDGGWRYTEGSGRGEDGGRGGGDGGKELNTGGGRKGEGDIKITRTSTLFLLVPSGYRLTVFPFSSEMQHSKMDHNFDYLILVTFWRKKYFNNYFEQKFNCYYEKTCRISK